MSEKEPYKPTDEDIDNIVDSIDFDKITEEAKANHDRIVKEAVDKAKQQSKDVSKKQRNIAIFGLIFGLIGIVGAIVALDTLGFFYLLAAGILGLLFSGVMFYISRQSKKTYEEWKQSQQN